VTVPVAVPRVLPVLGAGTGTADRVGFGGHERVEERGQHGSHEIRAGLRELLGQATSHWQALVAS